MNWTEREVRTGVILHRLIAEPSGNQIGYVMEYHGMFSAHVGGQSLVERFECSTLKEAQEWLITELVKARLA